MIKIKDEKIIESYIKYQSVRKVGFDLGISHETARYKLKKLGVLNSPIRYKWNDNYFVGDSKGVLYWAGFIAADGCVKLANGKYKQLSIGLAQKDGSHLLLFKNKICFTGPIHEIPINTGGMKSEIKISSGKLFDDLARFNIVPRKSLIYTFPEWLIDHPDVNHFMRGYFDGDGSFYESVGKNRKVEQLHFSVRGTKSFLSTYKKILEHNCNLRTSDKKPRLNSGIYDLGYGGNHAVGRIRDFLYLNSTSTIRLKRKYNIAFDDKFINIPKNYGHKRFVPVVGTNLNTGEILYFDSMKDVENMGFTKTNVSACCRGKSKYHKGYTWKYA